MLTSFQSLYTFSIFIISFNFLVYSSLAQSTNEIHKDTIGVSSLEDSTILLIQSNRFEEASTLKNKVEEIYKKVFASDNFMIITFKIRLWKVYYGQRAYPNSKSILEETLPLVLNTYGPVSQEAGEIFNRLGKNERSLFDLKQALQSHQKALEIFQKLPGDQDRNLAQIYLDIGNVILDQGDQVKALQQYQLAKGYALNIRESKPDMLRKVANNSGALYYRMGDLENALKETELAHEISLEMFGMDNQETINQTNFLGALYLEKGFYNKALVYLENSYTAQKKIGGLNSIPGSAIYNNFAN